MIYVNAATVARSYFHGSSRKGAPGRAHLIKLQVAERFCDGYLISHGESNSRLYSEARIQKTLTAILQANQKLSNATFTTFESLSLFYATTCLSSLVGYQTETTSLPKNGGNMSVFRK